jgi:hypothetical protein
LIFPRGFVSIEGIKTTFLYALHDPRPGDTHVYIGKADDPKKRLYFHRYRLKFERSHKASWYRSLLEIGLEPRMEIIKEVPFSEWQIWEMTFIHWYRVLGWRVVNETAGGEGWVNRKHTPESAAKISAANLGKKRSESYKQYLRDKYARGGHPMLGKTLSPAHKAALSAATKGRPKSAETRARMSASGGHHLRGKTLSPEHCAKLSASKKGRPQAPEHSAKIGAALKGKPKSDEARRKMSESAKRRCEREKLTYAQNGDSLMTLP